MGAPERTAAPPRGGSSSTGEADPPRVPGPAARRRSLDGAMDAAHGLLAVPDLPAFLLGGWTIEREIDDRLGGRRGTLRGTATFRARDERLEWLERGTLRIGDLETAATRRLWIVPAGTAPEAGETGGTDPSTPPTAHGAGRWEVRFEDGRPFHPLDLRDGGCAVDHPCRDDHYAGSYAVLGRDAFRARWRVVGPRKDQLISSLYRR